MQDTSNLHNLETPLRRPDGTPFSPVLPTKFTRLRRQQIEVAQQAADMMSNGTDIVIIQAQVGFGKTLLAELVRQIMGWRMVYIPPHIQLQRQFLGDFFYARLLMGRSNFPHAKDPGHLFPNETCADCHSRALCEGKICDYKKAKALFKGAQVGVCNLAYFLNAAQFLSMFQSNLDATPVGIRPGSWTPVAMIDLKGQSSSMDCASEYMGVTVFTRGEYEAVLAQAFIEESAGKYACLECGRKDHSRWMAIISTQKPDGGVIFSAVGFSCIDKIDVTPCPPEWALIRSDKNGEDWVGDYLTVLDEADVLESSLLGFVGAEFSLRTLERIGTEVNLEPPAPPVRNMDDKWWDWLVEVRKFVNQGLELAGPMQPGDIRGNRFRSSLNRLYGSLLRVQDDWVYHPVRQYSGGGDNAKRTGEVTKVSLAPLTVGHHGRDAFWRFIKHGIMMSGTILSSDQFAAETGLDQTGLSYATINVESKWHRYRRPVYRFKGISVTKNDHSKPWRMQNVWPDLLNAILHVLETYPDERTLVHTVSHDLTMELSSEIGKRIGYKRILTHIQEMTPDRRESVTEQFTNTVGGVLFSAVASRGLNLPGDKCRNVIIAKCPWLNIGDKRVKMRLESPGGRDWYTTQTMRDFVQMTGRAMRSASDWCRIWCIDEQINRLLKHKNLLPGYFMMTVRPEGQFFVPDFPELGPEDEE